ncbi:MAG: 4-oxalocrotonate tautomerase DmpI [Elusimicrobiota bacterium]
MPTVKIEGPKIDSVDKKRDLTKKVTDALEETYGLPRQAYVVLIKENKSENVSVGGKLIIDQQ